MICARQMPTVPCHQRSRGGSPGQREGVSDEWLGKHHQRSVGPASALRRRVLGVILALGVLLGLAALTPTGVWAAEAPVVTGPASIMDVTTELRRHHIREYRLDAGGSVAIDYERYLRDHREREYGS